MVRPMPSVEQFAKVHLPGESPWAECLAVMPDNQWVGRIDNFLVGQSEELRRQISIDSFGNPEPLPCLHDYKKYDVVIFKRLVEGDLDWWVPVHHFYGEA